MSEGMKMHRMDGGYLADRTWCGRYTWKLKCSIHQEKVTCKSCIRVWRAWLRELENKGPGHDGDFPCAVDRPIACATSGRYGYR